MASYPLYGGAHELSLRLHVPGGFERVPLVLDAPTQASGFVRGLQLAAERERVLLRFAQLRELVRGALLVQIGAGEHTEKLRGRGFRLGDPRVSCGEVRSFAPSPLDALTVGTLARPREEALLHPLIRAARCHRDRRRTRPTGAELALATVERLATATRSRCHRTAAARTVEDASEERGARTRARRTRSHRRLSGVPQGLVHERVMRHWRRDAAEHEFPDVEPRLHHAAEAVQFQPRARFLVPPLADARPRRASGAALKHRADEVRHATVRRVIGRDEALPRVRVLDGDVAGEQGSDWNAALDRVVRVPFELYSFLLHVALRSRHHKREHFPALRRPRVNVEVREHERAAKRGNLVQDLQRAFYVARESVQLGEYEHVHGSRAEEVYPALESLPVHRASADVHVIEASDELDSTGAHLLYVAPLIFRGPESVPVAGTFRRHARDSESAQPSVALAHGWALPGLDCVSREAYRKVSTNSRSRSDAGFSAVLGDGS